jgi:hypothetical protein
LSRKNVISLNLLSGLSASMSSNITSREVDVSQLDKAIIHCSWVAGPVGEFQVEAQADTNDSWFVLDTSSAWSVSGSDSEAEIILNELPFKKIRLKWVRTSGSGTLSAYLSSKSVGA